jgi:Polysaccharide biosynthesis protein
MHLPACLAPLSRRDPAIALVAVVAILAVDRSQVGPLVMTIVAVVPPGLLLALGRLQGEERLTAHSLCFVAWGVSRPILFLPLVAFALGVYAALGAAAVAVVLALSAAFCVLRGASRACEPSAAEWRAFTRSLVPLVVSLCGLGLLTQLDVIVAKLVLGDDSAGQFAATATLAKAVYLVPQAVSLVLPPPVATRSAAEQDTGTLVGLGVGVTLVAGGLATAVLWLIAEPLLRITYDADFTVSAELLGAYAAASTLVGALIVVINHHVALGADRFVWGWRGSRRSRSCSSSPCTAARRRLSRWTRSSAWPACSCTSVCSSAPGRRSCRASCGRRPPRARARSGAPVAPPPVRHSVGRLDRTHHGSCYRQR